eukprot:NODE_4561_length_788_cov_16.667118_g3790_i0.p4 GENE.NODE_4561_length_788_cov_16.667118_g3790_i0~~NODE_4561_length_788_cov_16.667118_g3790_i0.p4  ORF type:complete len:53 (-),score=3.64 NODE_4561_length_788_cov_16.667118_g3790_i0:460-618(-)
MGPGGPIQDRAHRRPLLEVVTGLCEACRRPPDTGLDPCLGSSQQKGLRRALL